MRTFLCLLFAGTASFAQTAGPDSATLQALLAEIRQLRQDLQATAMTIQRVQIVMFRLQTESTLLSRAMQRVDEARNRCSSTEQQRKMTSSQLEQAQERLRNARSPAEGMNFEEMIPRLKSTLDMLANEEQQCQAKEGEAESQFRAEQAKMSELQDQLDKIDKAMENATKR